MLKAPVRPKLFQQYGVVGYLADNALTLAGGSVLWPKLLAQEYKIDYVRPAHGRTLVARKLGGLRRQEAGRVPLRHALHDGRPRKTLRAVTQGTTASFEELGSHATR